MSRAHARNGVNIVNCKHVCGVRETQERELMHAYYINKLSQATSHVGGQRFHDSNPRNLSAKHGTLRYDAT